SSSLSSLTLSSLPDFSSEATSSGVSSKWSSMTCLLRLVTKTTCSMPASRASSRAYCTTGRSTMVSISLGMALVAGRKRVPLPATGMTALRTVLVRTMELSFVLERLAGCGRRVGSRGRRQAAPPGGDRHGKMPERDGIAERHLEGGPERAVLEMADEGEEGAGLLEAARAAALRRHGLALQREAGEE